MLENFSWRCWLVLLFVACLEGVELEALTGPVDVCRAEKACGQQSDQLCIATGTYFYKCNCGENFIYSEEEQKCVVFELCKHLKPCGLKQLCKDNAMGGFKCECKTGFTWTSDGKNCEDIKECSIVTVKGVDIQVDVPERSQIKEAEVDHQIENDDQEEDSQLEGFTEITPTPVNPTVDPDNNICRYGNCIEEEGGYSCSCPSGYYLDELGRRNPTCQRIRKCDSLKDTCQHICINTEDQAGYTCDCLPGFIKNGTQCHVVEALKCDRYCEVGSCVKNPDDSTEQCVCDRPYTGSSCSKNSACNGFCDENADCQIFEEGRPFCTCKEGYTEKLSSSGDLVYHSNGAPICVDKNECEDIGICGANSNCQNTEGGFRCECKCGYRRDKRRRCTVFQPCANVTCHENSICVYHCNGSSTLTSCVCLVGFHLENGKCLEDLDLNTYKSTLMVYKDNFTWEDLLSELKRQLLITYHKGLPDADIFVRFEENSDRRISRRDTHYLNIPHRKVSYYLSTTQYLALADIRNGLLSSSECADEICTLRLQVRYDLGSVHPEINVNGCEEFHPLGLSTCDAKSTNCIPMTNVSGGMQCACKEGYSEMIKGHSKTYCITGVKSSIKAILYAIFGLCMACLFIFFLLSLLFRKRKSSGQYSLDGLT